MPLLQIYYMASVPLISFLLFLLTLSLSSLSQSSPSSSSSPLTPRASLIRYWNRKVSNNIPHPKFFLSKLSPLTPLDLATYSSSSLSPSQLSSFCSAAHLACSPAITPSPSLAAHSGPSAFSTYNNSAFNNYATKATAATSAFSNYSSSEGAITTDTFRRYSRDASAFNDSFIAYSLNTDSVVTTNFTSYSSSAHRGTGDFAAYHTGADEPNLAFTSYDDTAAGPLARDFKSYADSTTFGFENFTSYGKHGTGIGTAFAKYSDNSDIITSVFSVYGEAATKVNDKFTSYGENENDPVLVFASYDDGAKAANRDFEGYNNNSNGGDEKFLSYGKKSDGLTTFKGYEKGINAGISEFSGYDQDGKGKGSNFTSYGDYGSIPATRFKAYGENGKGEFENFTSYGNMGALPGTEFTSYGENGKGGGSSFTLFGNNTVSAEENFASYGKNGDGQRDSFVNYGLSINPGLDNFTGYGEGSTSDAFNFTSYQSENPQFKTYANAKKGNEFTFKSYVNASTVPHSNDVKVMNSAEKEMKVKKMKKKKMMSGSPVNWRVEPGKFFRESNLKKGNVMPMPDIRDKMPSRSFLPRSLASKIPFSAGEVRKTFNIPEDGAMGKAISDTIAECQRVPSRGETKRCATSAEDMIDFAVSVLGSDVVVRSTENTRGSKGDIMIGDVKGVNGGKVTKSVSCHQSLFPYLVYYCHSVPKVRAYEADILAVDSKEKINHGIAICHIDTSDWSAGHGAFVALGSAPGKIEVCHWIFEGDMTWATAD